MLPEKKCFWLKSCSGMTLLELLIALAISAIVMMAAYQLLMSQNQSYVVFSSLGYHYPESFQMLEILEFVDEHQMRNSFSSFLGYCVKPYFGNYR